MHRRGVGSLRQAPLPYLGHRVARDTIALGPKARRPERAAAALQAYGALWMWGA